VSDQHRHDDNASPLFLLLSTNGLPSSIGQLRRWPCPHSFKRDVADHACVRLSILSKINNPDFVFPHRTHPAMTKQNPGLLLRTSFALT
jgi:hypothetical protein